MQWASSCPRYGGAPTPLKQMPALVMPWLSGMVLEGCRIHSVPTASGSLPAPQEWAELLGAEWWKHVGADNLPPLQLRASDGRATRKDAKELTLLYRSMFAGVGPRGGYGRDQQHAALVSGARLAHGSVAPPPASVHACRAKPCPAPPTPRSAALSVWGCGSWRSTRAAAAGAAAARLQRGGRRPWRQAGPA